MRSPHESVSRAERLGERAGSAMSRWVLKRGGAVSRVEDRPSPHPSRPERAQPAAQRPARSVAPVKPDGLDEGAPRSVRGATVAAWRRVDAAQARRLIGTAALELLRLGPPPWPWLVLGFELARMARGDADRRQGRV